MLVSLFAASGAAIGGGCAQPAVPPDPTGTGTGGGSAEARCTGTPPACVGLDDFDCQTTNGCAHVGKCEGTSVDCSLLSATGCVKQGGCNPITTGNCFGTPQQCFNFGNQQTCAQQTGCTWNPNKFACDGSPTSCQQLSNPTCLTQLGCTLKNSNECGGVATACSTFTAQGDCNKEIGCNWLSQCTGTAAACKTFSDADCKYQPGCSCEECEAGSSSSTGGNPVCTSQNDCDPAKDPCNTGNCVNGACVRFPECQRCVKQIECNPHEHPCFTGNCIDGKCQAAADCKSCSSPSDCSTSVNKCFTTNCIDGACEAKTMCTGGDGCCPPGCAGVDSDCP